MEKSINYKTQEMTDEIGKMLAESGLPPVNIRIILQDLLNEAKMMEQTSFQLEKAEHIKELEKKKDLKLNKNKMKGIKNDKKV